jgi:hypothetical protein
MASNDGAAPLFGCLGLVIFVVGIGLSITGVGAVAGIPLIIFVIIGAKLVDKG